MSSCTPFPHILRRSSGPVRWSPWGWLNSAEGSPLSTGLQNRACQFPGTRLLSDIALVVSTSCRGYVPMHVIGADEMQEFQVAEPVVLVVTVFMVDFCLLIHGEEQSAMHTSSA